VSLLPRHDGQSLLGANSTTTRSPGSPDPGHYLRSRAQTNCRPPLPFVQSPPRNYTPQTLARLRLIHAKETKDQHLGTAVHQAARGRTRQHHAVRNGRRAGATRGVKGTGGFCPELLGVHSELAGHRHFGTQQGSSMFHTRNVGPPSTVWIAFRICTGHIRSSKPRSKLSTT